MSRTTISKPEMQRLSPEQQETIASMKLSKDRNRRHLLELARGSRPISWFPVLAPGLILLALMIPVLVPMREYHPWSLVIAIACPVMILSLEIASHQRRLNRRLDALLELLELDANDRDGFARDSRAGKTRKQTGIIESDK